MNRPVLFDTNIIVDADDRSEPAKRQRAIDLIARHAETGPVVISLQVLQEYFSAATRKLGMDPAAAQRKVEVMALMRVVNAFTFRTSGRSGRP